MFYLIIDILWLDKAGFSVQNTDVQIHGFWPKNLLQPPPPPFWQHFLKNTLSLTKTGKKKYSYSISQCLDKSIYYLYAFTNRNEFRKVSGNTQFGFENKPSLIVSCEESKRELECNFHRITFKCRVSRSLSLSADHLIDFPHISRNVKVDDSAPPFLF